MLSESIISNCGFKSGGHYDVVVVGGGSAGFGAAGSKHTLAKHGCFLVPHRKGGGGGGACFLEDLVSF